MAKNKDLVNTFEVLMATSNKSESSKRTGMIKNGTLRKIAPKIYTTNMKDSPNEIVARNLFYILGHLYPHAVISHRSAFELRPTDTGDIFLTYSYSKKISLPGVTVHLLQGPMGTEYDMPFIENLYVSSNERRILENLKKGRVRSGSMSKSLPREIIEEYLEKILQVNGEQGLNMFRDKARQMAKLLTMEAEFDILNSIIGALLATKPSTFLTSDSAIKSRRASL